jgi:multiple sugar transport system ATP-binding protein
MGERIVVMKDGLIQQVADPITLYDHPLNRFIAGFIGTPPMNFFDGMIKGRDQALTFEGPGGMSLVLNARQRDALLAHRDKPVVLGLRPEDIGSPAAEQVPQASRIRALVDVVEPMGSESYIYHKVADTSFVSRVDAHQQIKEGQTVEPAVYMDKAHFFDPANDLRIG